MTRPDIYYIVSSLARRNAKASQRHMEAAIRVLQYLFHTKTLGHTISAGTGVTIWADASHGGEGGKGQTGIISCIGDTAIGWSSRRQNIVALSSTEAEYVALTAAAQGGGLDKGPIKRAW